MVVEEFLGGVRVGFRYDRFVDGFIVIGVFVVLMCGSRRMCDEGVGNLDMWKEELVQSAIHPIVRPAQ